MSTGTHHSDKPDSIETKGHSNAPKKNNSQFEIVAESLEEMEDEAGPPEGGDTPSAAAGEGGEHQEKMKALIKDMLTKLSEMGSEYGMSMEVSDESGAEGDAAPPEAGGEEQMQEMVERLTSRVAARLVKESKKKR